MLTQLTTVKARVALVDGTYDAILTDAIKAVSTRFDRHCGRTFAMTVDAVHEFVAHETELIPACYAIETVAGFELKIDEVGGFLPVTAPSYLVRKATVITLGTSLGTTGQLGRIVYTGGYVLPGSVPGAGQTALPADVEHAAIEQIAAWFLRRDMVGLLRNWPSGGVFMVFNQEPLLPGVGAVLERYRRLML